jgi:hypothetical protein
MISTGVWAGAPIPDQPSPMVGTSGRACERVAGVTAIARILPALMCSIDEAGCRT